jgi:hypothetical protein
MRARQQLDQGKLLARHARELDALRNRQVLQDRKLIGACDPARTRAA